MSPQDTVERVLKEMHLAFSRSESFNGDPDLIIIDRREFLELLDRLNKGLYDLMEQYEQTQQGRELAERAFRRKGDEIIEQANASAEDVYAASVLYTADAISRIRDLMDQTNDSMNDLFRQFRKDLKQQKEQLKSNEIELQAQLQDMADARKYLGIIEDMNAKRARAKRDLEAEKKEGEKYVRNMIHPSGTKPNTEPLDIKVNQNAEYFKWKAQAQGEIPEEVPVFGSIEEAQGVSEEAADGEQAFPNEEAIRQAVLEDEMAAEAEQMEAPRRNGKSILKNLIFGKEE